MEPTLPFSFLEVAPRPPTLFSDTVWAVVFRLSHELQKILRVLYWAVSVSMGKSREHIFVGPHWHVAWAYPGINFCKHDFDGKDLTCDCRVLVAAGNDDIKPAPLRSAPRRRWLLASFLSSDHCSETTHSTCRRIQQSRKLNWEINEFDYGKSAFWLEMLLYLLNFSIFLDM